MAGWEESSPHPAHPPTPMTSRREECRGHREHPGGAPPAPVPAPRPRLASGAWGGAVCLPRASDATEARPGCLPESTSTPPRGLPTRLPSVQAPPQNGCLRPEGDIPGEWPWSSHRERPCRTEGPTRGLSGVCTEAPCPLIKPTSARWPWDSGHQGTPSTAPSPSIGVGRGESGVQGVQNGLLMEGGRTGRGQHDSWTHCLVCGV